MYKKGDFIHSDIQARLEESVINYQNAHEKGKSFIDEAYHRVIDLYNPMDFYSNWYDQYKYLYDTEEDFISDYLRVFITVLLNWKPRNQRKISRYNGSGEFKNYFIGSLYHNFINMVKSDQAAKRNLTKQCPICDEWVNPISTHLISYHSNLLWEYLEEMNIDIDSLISCPLCANYKMPKSATDKNKIKELIKAHFISKHTSLLFHKFNEMYPGISTISPKIISSHLEENDDDLDIYDITEDKNNLINNLLLMNLSSIEKKIVEQILNGDLNILYKPEKHKCTQDEWDVAMENIKEAMNICGLE
jgi:hypothetical protein